MNLCNACNEDFASLSAFDEHRVGKHAYLYSEEQVDGRRCRTPDELRSLGMRKDSRGRWRLPIRGTQPWTSDVTDQRPRERVPGPLGQDGIATRQKRYITRAQSTRGAGATTGRGRSRRDPQRTDSGNRSQPEAPRA